MELEQIGTAKSCTKPFFFFFTKAHKNSLFWSDVAKKTKPVAQQEHMPLGVSFLLANLEKTQCAFHN